MKNPGSGKSQFRDLNNRFCLRPKREAHILRQVPSFLEEWRAGWRRLALFFDCGDASFNRRPVHQIFDVIFFPAELCQ